MGVKNSKLCALNDNVFWIDGLELYRHAGLKLGFLPDYGSGRSVEFNSIAF
jgi:hypothetical protein